MQRERRNLLLALLLLTVGVVEVGKTRTGGIVGNVGQKTTKPSFAPGLTRG